MESKLYRALTAMLWLALPLTAVQYWSVWDQLPSRMATHFGAAGQPNGWMTRETSLIFAMVVTTLVLVALTWAQGEDEVNKADHHPLAGRAAYLYEVLIADEDIWGEEHRA